MKRMKELSGFLAGRIANCFQEPAAPDGQAGETKPTSLADILMGEATGFAVERDGIILVETVASTRQGSIANAVFIASGHLIDVCDVPGCDCQYRILSKVVPNARLIEVNVTERT